MARFEGIPLYTGTFDTCCIYRMHGKYFMRSRSSLTRERVKQDPAFRKTREYARLLGAAARLSSAFYATLPVAKKQLALYRTITGEIMYWLKLRWQQPDIFSWLQLKYGSDNTDTVFSHTRLNPVYRRRTPMIRPGTRLGVKQLQALTSPEEYSDAESYRQEYVLRRRLLNKQIQSHAWAVGWPTGVKPAAGDR